jgi:hypothetical protein
MPTALERLHSRLARRSEMKLPLKCFFFALCISPVQAQELHTFNLKLKVVAQSNTNVGTAPYITEALSRALMPEIRGMQRESVTLKRDKIAFNYSFK